MAEETGGEKPAAAPQLNLQPIVDALAPKAAELLERLIANAQTNAASAMTVERWVAALAALVVLGVVGAALSAARAEAFDTVERLLIPLISFAGGFGIGARVSRQTSKPG